MVRTTSSSGRLALTLLAVAAAGCSQKPAPAPTPTPRPTNGAGPAMPTPTPGTPGLPGTPGGTPPAGLPAGFPGGGAAPGEPNPRPYAQVVTAQAVTKKGLFATHLVRGRLLFEIPRAELGRDLLAVSSLKGSPDGIGIRGTLGGSVLVRFERKDNRVLARAVNFRNITTDSTDAIARALPIIQFLPIVASFNIESFGPDSAPVIDVTRMFTGGVPEFAALGRRAAVDATRSFIEKVSAYPKNVEIDASQTFTAAPAPAFPGLPAPPGGANPNATTELYHFSLVKLPERPMMARLADPRVIWFSTRQSDFGSPKQKVETRSYINRWRLEKKDPSLAVSEPVKPITYYIDPATPTWLVPFVKAGIEEWQPAFEKAGFRRAIVGREVPQDSVELLNGEDASVSMVRWLPSPVENAVGPSTVDPRSGEILDADVQMYHNIMNLQRSWYFTQVGHLDPRAQKGPFPRELMGRLVQFVVAHEVGHTLGFPHNMKASSQYPLDSIRNPAFVKRMGHSPSIMDYARFNYVAQPEDGIAVEDLVPKVGTYDTYAVQWGYTPVPGARTPEAEKAFLDSLARLQETTPWFRSAADGGIGGPDPGEMSEVIGDADPVRATALGVRNLQRVVKLLPAAATSTPGETYDDLQELYDDVVGQWRREMNAVLRVVGGADRVQRATGQAGQLWTPVSAARQKAALAFLQANAFTTPTWLVDTAITRKFEATGSVNRVGGAMGAFVNALLSDTKLQRMLETDATPVAGERYTLPQYLADLRRGLWSETATGAAVDAYRRRAQRTYVETMIAKTKAAAPNPAAAQLAAFGISVGTPADLRAIVRAELRELERALATGAAKTSDRMTRAHYEDARLEIRRALDTSAGD
jgi:hypothetical protein